MSDKLTHWAVFEDCRRLVPFLAPEVEPVFARVMNEQAASARLGAVTRGEGYWITPTIETAREDWALPERHPGLDCRLAMALAGLGHTACDRMMKPLMQRLVMAEKGREDALEDVNRWVYAYQDVHVFRQVYREGKEEPFNRFYLADNRSEPGRALERLAGGVFQAAMLTNHGMAPDPTAALLFCEASGADRREWTRWIDHLYLGPLPLYVDIGRLVEAYHRPDPRLVERFEIESSFYRSDDPAIGAARALQRREPMGGEQVGRAVKIGANRSSYGQALEWSVEYLRRATAFWRREAEGIPAENYETGAFRAMVRSQGAKEEP